MIFELSIDGSPCSYPGALKGYSFVCNVDIFNPSAL